MKATIFSAGLVIVVIGSLSRGHAQEAPPRPPELKVLEKFVGTWDSESLAKPAEWTPKGGKTKGRNKYEWVLDGRFLQDTEQNGDALVLGWWSYHMPSRAYRGWFFMSDSSVVEWKGQWDADAGGLRMEADMGNGIVLTGVNRFPDKDTYEWVFLARDQAGKVYLDVKETHRRRQAPLEKSKENKAEAGPPELRILERYLGKWSTATVKKAAEWNPKETRTTGMATNEWVLDGRFMEQRGKESSGAEHIQLRTYDPQRKQFRQWHFDSLGRAVSGNGTWNEKARTMTWKADLGNGVTGTNTVRFVGGDTIEWRVVATNEEGKLFVDMNGKFSRRK